MVYMTTGLSNNSMKSIRKVYKDILENLFGNVLFIVAFRLCYVLQLE